jgi:hypothetical protein
LFYATQTKYELKDLQEGIDVLNKACFDAGYVTTTILARTLAQTGPQADGIAGLDLAGHQPRDRVEKMGALVHEETRAQI